jgi:predicted methyltransferase
VTNQGREELEQGLRQITAEEATITGHVAAIRPGTRQQRTVCRIHPEYPQLAILNGLGSKGSLLAPIAARQVIELSSSTSSTKREAQQKPRSLTKLAHSIVRRTIQPGDTVIDATAGNGHDTVFLIRCIGAGGRVIAIDIQHSAIQSTHARLAAEGLSGVELLVADHSAELSRLAEQNNKAKVIMFNLGYLPGGDKQQTTLPASTFSAITAGLRMLSPGGVMTVIAYRGHTGGQQEAQAVEDLARTEESSQISVDRIAGSEDNTESPVLYVFRRH